MFNKSNDDKGNRTFQVLHDDPKRRPKFAGNSIQTSKYTIYNFIFLNLWEQFHKLSNIYFLIISILQFIPIVSSMTPTSWIPLSIVLVTNMVKEGVEDYRRAQMDKETNGRLVNSIDPDELSIKQLQWKDVTVGSVVYLKEDELLPADIMILATSDFEGGLCYIETSNLDGETNLKNRESIEETHKIVHQLNNGEAFSTKSAAFLSEIQVECETPNERLHVFSGSLSHSSWQQKVGVSNKQVIYRGCTLRNIRWIYGLVVFAGMETKLMMNATEKRIKRTSLDNLTNRYLIGVFCMLGCICIAGGILSGIWIANNNSPEPWYLGKQLGRWEAATFLNMITFLILLSAMIPISLTVTMEMIKLGHAMLINWDLNMCYEDPITNVITPARARTSNLSEDLGRIQYIFSDKTGTLTQNVMEYLKCSIKGESYGSGTTEIGRAACKREGRPIPDDIRPTNFKCEPGNNFYDPRIVNGAWRSQTNYKDIEAFFVCLAVCHTVMAKPKQGDENDPNSWTPSNVTYQASSPDEEALVMGAKGSGFWFKRRNYKEVSLVVDGEDTPRCYEVLNVNEFNSTRKRMSAVIKTPQGQLMLMCKGADSVIYERLTRDCPERESTKDHLRDFANEGLRTLCLAQREMGLKEYQDWNQRYLDAFTSTVNREEKLEVIAEEVEKEFTLLGATAIEDKLQVGVPDTIAKLASANIQIWVLTGDKVETAINIAMACNLLDISMTIEKVSLPDPPYISADDPQFEFLLRKSDEERNEMVKKQLVSAFETNKNGYNLALVIDGYSLEFALHQERDAGNSFGPLMTFTERCKAVVCCRVSPKQKADVVKQVRVKKNVTTLAIGDGANDVSMIKEAHIGVGISGKEGVQAVAASDYAVAQFRYLQQLVIIHGRWDFQRVSLVILYFFYKNIVFAMVSFLYGIHSGFSGVNFWDDYYQSVWNVVFTSVPILVVSLCDKDVVYQSTLHHFPSLYTDVQCGRDFTGRRFFYWMIDAIWCSLMVYFIPVLIFDSKTLDQDSKDIGKWELSFTVFACCHTICNLRLALITKTWTIPTAVLTALSILSYWVFSAIFCNLPLSFVKEMYEMFQKTFTLGIFWHTLFLTVIICLLPPTVQFVLARLLVPTKSQRIAKFEAKVIRGIELELKPSKTQIMPEGGNKLGCITEEQFSSYLDEFTGPSKMPSTNSVKIFVNSPPKPLTASSVPDSNSKLTITDETKSVSTQVSSIAPRRRTLIWGNNIEGHSEFLGYSFSQEPGASPEVQMCSAGTTHDLTRKRSTKTFTKTPDGFLTAE